MRRLRRLLAAAALLAGAGLVGLALLALATARSGDPGLYPPPAGEGVEVLVVDHGFHTGLGLPREALEALAPDHPALRAVLARFPGYPWLEIGWGEDVYYRAAPTVEEPLWGLALRALFRPGNASVMHVVGLAERPEVLFAGSSLVPVRLSRAGFERLALGLEASFRTGEGGGLAELGVGLYGPSLFFRANGSFSLLRVCNRWTADLLDAAGVPTAPVLATLPGGLVADLRFRSGLPVLRPR